MYFDLQNSMLNIFKIWQMVFELKGFFIELQQFLVGLALLYKREELCEHDKVKARTYLNTATISLYLKYW